MKRWVVMFAIGIAVGVAAGRLMILWYCGR